LYRWRNHFSQLFNVHEADDVRHTVKSIVPEPSAFDIGMAIEKLKRYKSSGIDQISAELIKKGAEQFALRSLTLFLLFGLRRNCLRSGRYRSLYLFIRSVIQALVVSIEA